MTTRGGGTSSRRSQHCSTSTRRVRVPTRSILHTPTWSLTLSVCAALLASRLTPALSTIPSFHLSMSPEKRAEHAAAAAAAGVAVKSPTRPVGVHAPPKSAPTLSPEKKRDREGGAIKFTDQTAQFGSPKQPTPSPARATPTPSPAAAKEVRPLQPEPQAQAQAQAQAAQAQAWTAQVQSPRPQSEGTKAVAAILHAGSDAKRAVVIDDDDDV